MDKKNIRVRWNPIYKPCATHTIIIGYNIYAYIGHPLWGEIHGTRKTVKTETEAKKEARKLRLAFV